MNTRTMIFALLAIFLAACSPEPIIDLSDTSWLLESMPGYADLGSVEVSLNFDDQGAVGGVGGCNSYGGSYELAGDQQIEFGALFSTEMYCLDNDASDIEAAFFMALSQAETYAQDFESLRIQTGQGELLFGFAP
jgi:putative lipoprotein